MLKLPGSVDRVAASGPEWPAPLGALAALLSGGDRPMPALDARGWSALAGLAIERHRVAPQCLAAIVGLGVAVPEPALRRLRAEARADAAAALCQKAESLRVLKALEEVGCDPAILKGWPLAEACYGAAGLRHANDIDLYIAPDEIDLTLGTLFRLGYQAGPEHAARMPEIGSPAFRAEYNDLGLVDPTSGIEVEVHWRNYHFRGWPELRALPDAFAGHPIDRTGQEVRVPAPAACLVCLALHGQQHLWLRLKWLLDIDRLARRRGPEALIDDLGYARRAGAGRAVALALRLSQTVFATPVPIGWPEPSPADRRRLVRITRLIASDEALPGGVATKLEVYRAALGFAESLEQRVGVLRYLIWRRIRLGALRGRIAPT